MNLTHINCNRPYLNRFVKRKQQQIEDNHHSANLKQIKPITSKMMEHSGIRSINNRKTEMIKEMKQIEIERENKMLLQKLAGVMSNYGAYSVVKTKSSRTKASRSLNDIYRKKQMENVERQNKRFLMRLQNKRATLDVNKLNREWTDNKKVIERRANCEFNLTNLRVNSRGRQSSTAQNFYRSKWEQFKVKRMKNIDGCNMVVKVQFTDGNLKIIGDCQDNKDLKVIEIPRDQALILMEKDCNGQIEQLFQKLKYDVASQTLYLISENIEQVEVDFAEFNPEMARIEQNHRHIQRGYNREGRRERMSKELSKVDSQKKQKKPKIDIIVIPAAKPRTAEVQMNRRQSSHNSISKSLLSVEPAVDTKDPLQRVLVMRDGQNPMGQYKVQMEAEQDYNEVNFQESLKRNEQDGEVVQQQQFIQISLERQGQQKGQIMEDGGMQNQV